MKKYIFLAMAIGGINGAEQYIFNKMNYLKDNDYKVFIFSGRKSEILIHAFDPFERLIRPALRFYPSSLRKKEREDYINWLLGELDIQSDDTFIIESSSTICSLWGDLIAERLHCRHFAYILHESFALSDEIRRFFRFKVSRHELAGIVDDSVQKMLGDPALEPRPDTRIRAFCNNVVQECDDVFSAQLNSDVDYNIGSIGRLEKNYVMPLIESLCLYFNNNPNKRFNLVLVGGCADIRQEKNIRKAVEKCKNVHLVLTGAMYPIPKSFVQKIDLFISAAGSASASFYAQRPTVKVDWNFGTPLGLLGYDLFPTGNLQSESKYRLEQYIDMVLADHVHIDYVDNYEESYSKRINDEFDRHLKIAMEPTELEYYNANTIKYTDVKYRICSVVSHLFGVKTAYGIVEAIRKTVRE